MKAFGVTSSQNPFIKISRKHGWTKAFALKAVTDYARLI
jgi:hypothetical protein